MAKRKKRRSGALRGTTTVQAAADGTRHRLLTPDSFNANFCVHAYDLEKGEKVIVGCRSNANEASQVARGMARESKTSQTPLLVDFDVRRGRARSAATKRLDSRCEKAKKDLDRWVKEAAEVVRNNPKAAPFVDADFDYQKAQVDRICKRR